MKGERTAEAKHTPWRIRPLGDKYYGTIVEDAQGTELYSFWEHELDGSHTPSARQLEYYDNPKPRSEDWSDLFCDSHHEGAQDYERAAVLVRAVNGYEAQRELIGELGEALRPFANIATYPALVTTLANAVDPHEADTLRLAFKRARAALSSLEAAEAPEVGR